MRHHVTFIYHTGLSKKIFSSARLTGSWDSCGRLSEQWATVPMEEIRDESGGQAFRARVEFPEDSIGTTYRWGVLVDGPAGRDVWADRR